MRNLSLFLLTFIPLSFTYAQPAIEWQKAYGGSADDGVLSTSTIPQMDLQQTSDGGYICVSSSSSTDGDLTGAKGNQDVWVIKMNSTGTIEWQKNYGGTSDDIGTGIMQTTDGGYIVSATSNSADGDVTGSKGLNDLWILKLDASGAITWQKALGGAAFENFSSSARQTADGGYIAACITSSTNGDVSGKHGSAFYDIWIVKLSTSGTLEWQKCLGGTDQEGTASVEPAKDGGYIVAGMTKSTDGDITTNYGQGDAWLVKLSATGTIQWQKTYGGTKADYFGMAIPAADGGYIALGNTNSKDHDVTSTHDTTEIWVVKTDDTGKILWQKTYGGAKYDAGYSIAQVADGHYLISGTTESGDGDVSGLKGISNTLLLNLYPDGSIRWSKVVGSAKREFTSRARPTSDGGTILVSSILEASGDATGSGFHGGLSDIWIVKLGSTAGVKTLTGNSGFKAYPNPATGIVNIELQAINDHTQLRLTDIKGALLKTIDVSKGKLQVDMTGLAAGIYMLEYNDGEHKEVIKLTKQ